MEALHVLEQKIGQLVALIREIKAENSELQTCNKALEVKNQELQKTIDTMEISLLSNKESVLEEAELTKHAVDELIKSIDSLVGEQRS
jgi:regulator of replication initiation timing